MRIFKIGCYICIILFFIIPSSYSQIKLLKDYPFQDKEEISYNAIYKWGFIELNAGIVTFSVDSLPENATNYYHFKGIGNTLPKYDWIYKIRDTFQSKVGVEYFQPVYYLRNTMEGKYAVNNKVYFNKEENRIWMQLENSEEGYREESLPYNDDILDLQTAVYFARMLDFSSAWMGEGYEFDIIIDGKPYSISIRYEGVELIVLNDKRYSCYRISTEVIEGTIFKSGQTIKIWVTDDGRQIPVKVVAPIIVGTVKAELIDDK